MVLLLLGIIFVLQYNCTDPPTLISAFSISVFFSLTMGKISLQSSQVETHASIYLVELLT